MTITLNPALEQQVAECAVTSGQTSEALVSEILTNYLQERTELLADLARARGDLAAGRVLTSDQVRQRLEKRFAVS